MNPKNRNINSYLLKNKNKKGRKRINHLLIIAIDEYKNGIPKLKNPVHDATTIAKILHEKYQFSPEKTTFLINEQATQSNIIKAFENHLSLTEDDNLIFIFTGHGEHYKPINKGYWIPVDAVADDRSTYLSNDEIKPYLSASKAHHIFGIVDSCFSGMLFRDVSRNKMLEAREEFPSRWLLTSGRDTVVPDGVGQHSPFAEALIGYLKYNREPIFSVAQFCEEVISSPNINPKQQVPHGAPMNLTSSLNGQFVFYKKDFEKNIGSEFEEKIEITETIEERKIEILTKKTITSHKEHLLALVAARKTNECLDYLEKKLKESSSELIMLQSRFLGLQEQKTLIGLEAYELRFNKLTGQSLIPFIEDVLEESDFKKL